MDSSNIYKKKKLDEIKDAELLFRENSLKTTNIETYKKFIKNYLEVYDTIWDVRTTKKWINGKFRTYVLKQKFVDNMVNCMTGENVKNKEEEKKKITVAYGDAKFAPTGKGERPGPTSWMSKQIAQRLDTVFVDEYNTTKKCHCCGQTLCAVNDTVTKEELARRKNILRQKLRKKYFNAKPDKEVKEEEKNVEKTVEIRGLRWCPTTHTYLNRDMNAALNILKVFNYKKENMMKDIDGRPQYLSRKSKNEETKPHSFSLNEIKKIRARKLLAKELKPMTHISLIRRK
jgi:hypothetical protein